jgi:arsenite-transporting ATPase
MDELDVEAVDSVDDEAEGGDADAGPASDGDGAHAHARPGDDAAVAPDEGAALPAGVDAPEYVLYGGKGGVGKTTMAAATALASAAGGATTLVVSTDPAHSLSDTLDVAVPAEPTQVREDVPLYAAEIDPEAAVEGSVLGAMGGGVDGDGDGDGGSMGAPFAGAGPGGADAFEGFGEGGDGANPLGGLGGLGGMAGDAASMPGADEAAAMQTLLRYMDDPRFDRVVVDTAPTGHTLRLLELPEFLDSMTGRLLTLRERLGGMMSGLNPFGDDAGEGDVDLEALRERVERLRAVLRDPSRTDFRVVLVPEEMSVVESERLVRRLREFEIPVGTVVVNRVMEGLDEVADVEAAGIDPGWVVTPDLESCAFCERRWQVQQRALARASDLFRGHDVARVPLLADEVRGEEALRVVAACLTA